MRKHNLFLFCYLLALPFLSANVDSLGYLTPKDTIFLKLGEFQEKIFEHIVEEQQTLYSIARFYGMHLEELFYYNPHLQNNVLSVGQIITIPIPNRAIMRYKNKKFQTQKFAPICYRVKKFDTLFRIAKVHFKMPVDTIIARNLLQSESLAVGQILHIGWMNIEGIPAHFENSRETLPINKIKDSVENTLKVVKSKRNGMNKALLFGKNKKQKSDFYALHRKAPINSIIGLTNPMNGKIIYAKVIGRIPEAVYGDEVVAVVSAKTADALGAKDARFFVRVKFLR